MARAGWAGAAAIAASAALGCGQQAPQDPSYILVELDQVGGSKGPHDVLVEISSSVASPQKLCVSLVNENTGTPASFVLFRKFGAQTAPRATVKVTAFSALDGDPGSPGSMFACPSAFAAPFGPAQTVTFDFCAGAAVKVQMFVGSSCPDCTAAADVCAAGLDTDGSVCMPGRCCSSAISDACALAEVPTTLSPAP